VELGSPVFTIGFPTPDILGWEPKFTDGTVSATSVDGDSKFLQMSVPVQGGNSGGPLVNDSGDVVGVVIAKLSSSAFDNVGFASKSSGVLSLLDEEPARATKNRSRMKSVKAVTAATCRIATKVASEGAEKALEKAPESPEPVQEWPE
jgi:S1-C subfamily serine protease